MIYPKFPRRTLALILFCLVITLGAVGVLFLVYFFNESSVLFMDSSLKTVYGDQKQNQQYRQNIMGNSELNFEKRLTNRYFKDVEESIDQVEIGKNINSTLRNSDEMLSSLSSSLQEFKSNYETKGFLLTKTINTKDSNTNLDTIYIDDFERPSYNRKSKSELNNIDYFDTILVDHKNENNNADKLSNLHLQEATKMRSLIYQTDFISGATRRNANENKRKLKINSKRHDNESRLNKTKFVKYTKLTKNVLDDDDAYDLEVDTTGSGSGDFVDDTEINEMFIKPSNIKMSLKGNSLSKSVKKYYTKNIRARKKHRNHIFNNDNQFISPPLLFTTVSSGDGRSINNWLNQDKLKKLSLYPTVSSSTSEQIHSKSIKKLQSANKKWPVPALISSNQKLIINEFDNNSTTANLPTSSYNNSFQSQLDPGEVEPTATAKVIESSLTNVRQIDTNENNEAWIETRTRRIMGNVKISEERSRQLLLCEEAGGGELCRMLFKGHIND